MSGVCLLVHGFNGRPDDIAYLGGYLRAQGLNTRDVLLDGHGGTKQDLRASSHSSWLGSVEPLVGELAREYGRVHLIGFSMGGLISACLSDLPGVGKLVLINTPIYFWNIKLILGDAVSGVISRDLSKIAYYARSVGTVSAKSSIDFLRVLARAKRVLAQVQSETLIVQCKRDESAHFKSAHYIKKKLGGRAGLRLYEGGCHQIFTHGPELRDTACADIYEFLARTSP